MAPTTTEEAIEAELSLAQENLTNAQMHMQVLRKEIMKAEDQLVECKIKVERIAEELRLFRAAYPSHCRRTRE